MAKAKSNSTSETPTTKPAEGGGASNVTPLRPAAPVEERDTAQEAATENKGSDASEQVVPPGCGLILFGRDDGGRAHASVFTAADGELATKAAGLMGFKVLPITSDEHRSAAAGLPLGRLFASGKAFAPFCKEASYAALETLGGAFQPPPPAAPEPEPQIVVTGPAQTWADVTIGNLVLASNGVEDGWWPAVVAEDRGSELFVLRWVGFSDEPVFVRRRGDLGLLPPVSAGATAA